MPETITTPESAAETAVVTRAALSAAFAAWIAEVRETPSAFLPDTGTPEEAGAHLAGTLLRRLTAATGVRGGADIFWMAENGEFNFTADELDTIAADAFGDPVEITCARTLPSFWVAALPAVDDRGEEMDEEVLFEARTREAVEAMVAAAREARAAAGGEG
jgi:hypothetical protein